MEPDIRPELDFAGYPVGSYAHPVTGQLDKIHLLSV
jgi:hypothetical protein